MRRARIKALATVPVRRKVVQNATVSDISNASNHENKEKEISNISTAEQEPTANVADVQDKTEKEQNKTCLAEPEPIIIDKPDFQEPCAQINDKPEKINQSVQKSVSPPEVPNIDIVSPTKIIQNRSCFMRPIPRLDSSGRVRKNSVQGSGASASESEDDSKRITAITSGRMRNDSICSIQSKEGTANDSQNNVARMKTTQKRRMLVSESARKLAEARREFLLKHENKTPDRSQLKMYDLIYYNPITNPMKKAKTLTVIPRQISIPEAEEMQEEEDEDDPLAMPVPQVKVGPDGQLIIDEQSLVIEQTSARKNKEALAQEAIVDDDNHGSGFYKKRQKTKEWPKWETFKFYRALNVVGTDFLLMQSLFPNRTRQQIKQKYKKEERVNRHLIEKALKYHQEFDTEMLEKQLAMLQKLENIQENMGITKKPEKVKNGQYETKKTIKRKRRLVAASIGECESSVNDQEVENTTVLTIDSEIDEEVNDETNSQQLQARKENRTRLKRYLDDNFDKLDDSSTSTNVDSDSDPEIYQIRPTRSGRLPKVKKLQGPSINNLDSDPENDSLINNKIVDSSQEAPDIIQDIKNNVNSAMPCPTSITNVIPDINQIEPGSLVILSKESADEPGNTILQVYMVSSNIDNNSNEGIKSNMTPVDLSPELLATVTTKLENVEAINVLNDHE